MSSAFHVTKRHKRLAADIRALRESKGLTIAQLVERTSIHADPRNGRRRISPRTYRRIENTECLPNPLHVLLIAEAVGLPRDQRDALVTRATALGARSWYDDYSPETIGPSLRDYLADESDAWRVQSFGIDTFDGLSQTPEYARAVQSAAVRSSSPSTLEDRVIAWQRRQERLTGVPPLTLEMVVTDAALSREVGGPATMGDQIQHLANLATLPNVTIQIIEAQTGAYPAMGRPPFYLLSLRSERPEIAYLEPGIYIDDERVEHHAKVFAALQQAALNPEESHDLLASAAATYGTLNLNH